MPRKTRDGESSDSERAIVAEAPKNLVLYWMEKRDAPSKEAWYITLRAMVTSPKMRVAWREIQRRVQQIAERDALDSERLFAVEAHEVYTQAALLVRSSTRPIRRRKDVADELRKIGKAAKRLAAAVNGTEHDKSIQRWMPDDAAAELIAYIKPVLGKHSAEWLYDEEAPDGMQSFLARRLKKQPSLSQFMESLEACADHMARQEMTQWRALEHVGNATQRELQVKRFVKLLSSWMDRHLEGQMPATVARITSAIYEVDLDEQEVLGLTRHASRN